ncbi:MAG: hypothetical protein ACTTIZ_07190 [Treponema sp.]
MKDIMKIYFEYMILLILTTILISCATIPNETSEKSSDKVDVFLKSGEKGLLEVVNTSDEDLVFFAGEIQNGNVLGGVRKSQIRKLDYSPFITNKQGVFLCRAVRFNDYKIKRRLGSEDVFYSHIVMYGDDKLTSITVPKEIGGDGGVVISNESAYVCEVLLDSPQGNVLITLLPHSFNKFINLKFKNNFLAYNLFFRFIYYDKAKHEIIASTPRHDNLMRIRPQMQGEVMMPISVFAPKEFINSLQDNKHMRIDLEF